MQNNPDYSQLLKIAQSPAGKQLLALLRRSGGTELQSAMNAAAAGDMEQAKAILGALLTHPEAEALVKQLEESL